MNKNLGWIKSFLKAKKPEKLMDLMLENNLKMKAYHDYDIIFDGQNWFAWFDVDINNLINEKVNVERKGQRSK